MCICVHLWLAVCALAPLARAAETPVAAAAPQPATAEGVALRDALLREAELPGKPSWQPMLRYLADLHGRSVLPPLGYFKYPYETMGPGYQNGRVFGHIDLTHERLDTVRALPEHARNQIRNELAGQQADGLIPGIVLFKGDKPSWKAFKGFPPIWVFAVDAYVEQTGDTAMLHECLEPLRRQIGWFETKRAAPGGGFYYLDERENTWESGMDEGIRWDVRPKEPLAAIDATSQVYALYDHAARWSRQLGEAGGDWEQKAADLKQFINRELWDPQTGFYFDAWVVHDPANRHLAFEGMWPLVVGAATPEQAQRVIDQHLLNPKEFFTPHPIATVAASDSKFELRMWRGPVWNSMTYWAARGCVNYGRGDAAHKIVEAALDATAVQFQRTGTIWEYYHPFVGDETMLRRKPNMAGMPNMPHRDYVGHNPLFAMADLWRKTGAPYQTLGVLNRLPEFTDALEARLTFPLSWLSGHYTDFGAWRSQARARVEAAWLTPPPPAPWAPQVIGEEDRGSYIARKVVFNVSADSRVLALMTIPKGKGPFPAVLLLHDHGARFDIGKEKVIRPFAGDPKLASAIDWANRGYGGKFIGDELAQRGYVCLAIDALNWSDRGGGGYEGQYSIASNLMHLGMSFAGLMAWEDLRSADFLADVPEVDPRRIAAVGWSMGAFRSWQVAAMSDRIAASVAICWMSTVTSLMTPGNNETTSSSSFAMLHPGLYADLDYPDIASIGCPKPMLFFNGRKDGLFPTAGVDRAYAKLHAIWTSQGADDRLVTKTWDTPHEFNAAMQAEAFAWLDRVLGNVKAQTAAQAVTTR